VALKIVQREKPSSSSSPGVNIAQELRPRPSPRIGMAPDASEASRTFLCIPHVRPMH
jgi:hypothetical protein